MSRYLLIDFYVDEPACFGVPPFISPYIRYTYGALKCANAQCQIDYITVDEIRQASWKIEERDYSYVFVIGGTTVPGRYLGGRIGSFSDLKKIIPNNKSFHSKLYVGGPLRYIAKHYKDELYEQGIQFCHGDVENFAYQIASNSTSNSLSERKNSVTYEEIRDYALKGAEVVTQHFRFPYIICELETYRGCTRNEYCSFCTEVFYGRPRFREHQDIIDEVSVLYDLGVRQFRLGRQADLLTYQADLSTYRNSYPRPNPFAIETLYRDIRKVAPQLKVLHLDNTNPGLIYNFPEESTEIIRTISSLNTPMDTAAMGVESVDPSVIMANKLKGSASEMRFAIELVHRYGSTRTDGLPSLSAGVNFIGGLPGETAQTFSKNFNFLEDLLKDNIFLRRINIRRALVFEKTKLEAMTKSSKKNKEMKRFEYFKKRVRNEIDPAMLQLAFPKGSIIKNVIPEKRIPGGFLGRALGSYPITCHIRTGKKLQASNLAQKDLFGPFGYLNVIVTGYKERAVYGVAIEDDFDQFDLPTLQKIFPRELSEKIWHDGLKANLRHLPDYFPSEVLT